MATTAAVVLRGNGGGCSGCGGNCGSGGSAAVAASNSARRISCATARRLQESRMRTFAVQRNASGRGDIDVTSDPKNKRAKPGTSDEYNRMMQQAMQNPFEYRHENGMYYTVILPDLLVGSQPQTPDDVRRLARREGVTHILNLQQDKDIRYWRVDFDAVRRAAKEERVTLVRNPVIDFSGDSLRSNLPLAVSKLRRMILDGGRAYVHCTAGLGRAPGVAIGYLYWFQEDEEFRDLDYSYQFLTSKRPCGPRKESIRGASEDMLRIAYDNTFSLGTVVGRLWWGEANQYDSSKENQRNIIKGLSIFLGDSNRHLILEDIIAQSETESSVKEFFMEMIRKLQNVL